MQVACYTVSQIFIHLRLRSQQPEDFNMQPHRSVFTVELMSFELVSAGAINLGAEQPNCGF